MPGKRALSVLYGREPESDTGFSNDVFRIRIRIAQLLPHLSNQDAQIVIFLMRRPPHLAQQLGLRDQPPVLFGQHREQGKFFPRRAAAAQAQNGANA